MKNSMCNICTCTQIGLHTLKVNLTLQLAYPIKLYITFFEISGINWEVYNYKKKEVQTVIAHAVLHTTQQYSRPTDTNLIQTAVSNVFSSAIHIWSIVHQPGHHTTKRTKNFWGRYIILQE